MKEKKKEREQRQQATRRNLLQKPPSEMETVVFLRLNPLPGVKHTIIEHVASIK